MQTSDTFQQLPGSPLWQSGTVELICQQVISQTDNVSTFVFQTRPSGRFHYKPGQFVTFQIEQDGERVSRSYTMRSSPSRPYLVLPLFPCFSNRVVFY